MSSTALTPVGQLVRAPKTAELIAIRLRTQIVRGELAAGDTLPPESDLMVQYGVSRPTLREAFRILETESLIHIRRGSRGGAQVTAPDMAVAARYVGLLLQIEGTTVADVYEARMALEPTCARMLATRATPADVAELRTAIDDVRTAVDTNQDLLHWSTLTYRFHELVMSKSGNKTLAVQGGVLQEIVARHVASTVVRSFDKTTTPQRFRRLIRSYTKLVDLVEAGDADGAEAHWRRHMEVAARSLTDQVGPKTVVELFSSPLPGK
jgi:GntR family transcriptional repressor for pyruvate dehydrogenase complex